VARILTSGDIHSVRLTHIFNCHVSRKRADWVPSSVRWTESIDEILGADLDIVIELVGRSSGGRSGFAGRSSPAKSVVTANKQLIAHHGELLSSRTRRASTSASRQWPAAFPCSRAAGGLSGDRSSKSAAF
jgi:homoserine dehydrogenase